MFVSVLFFEKVEVLIIEGYAKKAEPLIFMCAKFNSESKTFLF